MVNGLHSQQCFFTLVCCTVVTEGCGEVGGSFVWQDHVAGRVYCEDNVTD